MKPRLSLIFPSRLLRPVRGRNENEQRRLFERAAHSNQYYRERRSTPGVVELEEFAHCLADFRNPKMPPFPQAQLRAPWAGARRNTVAIGPWFRLERDVRVLRHPSCHNLMEAEPAALAAPVNILRGVAEAVAEGRLRLPTLRFGVIAWLGVGRELLTDRDRERFWEVFETPVFAQFRGFAGELLAEECECAEGLHVAGEAGRFEPREDSEELLLTSYASLRHPVIRLATRFAGWVDERPCPCGRPGPMLRELAPYRRDPWAQEAAGEDREAVAVAAAAG